MKSEVNIKTVLTSDWSAPGLSKQKKAPKPTKLMRSRAATLVSQPSGP